jgi:hypothetical protein
VNHVKHLGVIFDKRITWRLHIEIIEAKAFRTFIAIYYLLKSERLRGNIKLTLQKALIRSVMTCLHRLGILKIAAPTKQGSPHHGHFPMCTQFRDLHTAFNLPYKYDYIIKLCMQQAEVIQNLENEHVRSKGQG